MINKQETYQPIGLTVTKLIIFLAPWWSKHDRVSSRLVLNLGTGTGKKTHWSSSQGTPPFWGTSSRNILLSRNTHPPPSPEKLSSRGTPSSQGTLCFQWTPLSHGTPSSQGISSSQETPAYQGTPSSQRTPSSQYFFVKFDRLLPDWYFHNFLANNTKPVVKQNDTNYNSIKSRPKIQSTP